MLVLYYLLIVGDESDTGNTGNTSCSSPQFQCSSSGQCITSNKQCDGNCHCSDCTDENNCCKSCLLAFITITMS